MTTYNGKALAAVVGCSRSTVQAAKNCGFRFLYGRTTTEQSWCEFLRRNPDVSARLVELQRQGMLLSWLGNTAVRAYLARSSGGKKKGVA